MFQIVIMSAIIKGKIPEISTALFDGGIGFDVTFRVIEKESEAGQMEPGTSKKPKLDENETIVQNYCLYNTCTLPKRFKNPAQCLGRCFDRVDVE